LTSSIQEIKGNMVKKPISCNNYFEIIQKVDECSQYIKSLFIDKPRQSILNSKFKTGFLGWLNKYSKHATDVQISLY